jgi:hypothetical protein
METNNLSRHKTIKTLLAQEPEKIVDTSINLWGLFASQVIFIVGESGFNALYARSVFLTQSSFPWLATGLLSTQTERLLAELKMNLEKQTPAQAAEASCFLLITFTDILASLIGEDLTSGILRSAWGDYTSYKAGMEFNND